MKKWLARLGAGIGVILFAFALFWYQPWSDFSPAGMNRTFQPDERVHHFRNMEDLYPSTTISGGPYRHSWPRRDGGLKVTYGFRGEQRTLDDFLARVDGTGLLVIRDGTILHERYRLGEDKDSRHTSWSVAKSFVSTLVGMAVDDGLITSVTDRVDAYIPELKGTAYGAARIRDLLQMSSGVDFFESYGEPGSNTSMQFSDAQKILYRTWGFGTPLNDILTGYGKKEEPGTRFEYRSSDTHVLAWLVSSVMEKPFAQIVEDRLWKPLGMEADATWLLDGSETGNPIGFCCLNATLRDFARLGELYRLGGVWNGQRLLSQQWIRAATVPDADHVQPENVYGTRGYQYQWWVPAGYDREYLAMGIWGQYIWVDEKAGVVIARTSVDPNFRLNTEETIVVFRAITKAVSAEPEGADTLTAN